MTVPTKQTGHLSLFPIFSSTPMCCRDNKMALLSWYSAPHSSRILRVGSPSWKSEARITAPAGSTISFRTLPVNHKTLHEKPLYSCLFSYIHSRPENKRHCFKCMLIMVQFVLGKLILQKHMNSHPLEPDSWSKKNSLSPYKLRVSSPECSQVVYGKSSKISWAGKTNQICRQCVIITIIS